MSDALRREYHDEGLIESELAATPWAQAREWVDDAVYRSAERDDVPEPLAMSLATIDAVGRPDMRTVLPRFFDPSGPGFVSSLESTKAVQISDNSAVAAAIVWPAMYRAIRFRGVARQLGRGEAERYFWERPWGSRIGAWASRQSQVIEGRVGLKRPTNGMPPSGPIMASLRMCPFPTHGRFSNHLRRGGVLGRAHQPAA